MITNLRPSPKRTLDQFGVTEETLASRANLLAARGFLKDSKILFLGDYDLTSLACRDRAENSELWALDVDSEVLKVVEREGKGGVRTALHNLTAPLPTRTRHAFDAVFTDPPYTPEGVSLFLSRALEALTKGERARIFLSYGSLDPLRARAVQERILAQGLVIEELQPRFNEYLAAKTIGDVSDLYILRPTAKALPTIRGEYRGKLYTYERSE